MSPEQISLALLGVITLIQAAAYSRLRYRLEKAERELTTAIRMRNYHNEERHKYYEKYLEASDLNNVVKREARNWKCQFRRLRFRYHALKNAKN